MYLQGVDGKNYNRILISKSMHVQDYTLCHTELLYTRFIVSAGSLIYLILWPFQPL